MFVNNYFQKKCLLAWVILRQFHLECIQNLEIRYVCTQTITKDKLLWIVYVFSLVTVIDKIWHIILISRLKGKVIVNQTKILQVFLIQNPIMLRKNTTINHDVRETILVREAVTWIINEKMKNMTLTSETTTSFVSAKVREVHTYIQNLSHRRSTFRKSGFWQDKSYTNKYHTFFASGH